MPHTPLIHRPQTLKQAKRAYRKSGGTVRLSESEKAIIERRAVLQERADRIKEREARRKANLKRKEERVQKEREARHRMGIATPPTGISVGPSQLHLSGFVYAGAKRKRGDGAEAQENDLNIQKQGEQVAQERQKYPMEQSPQSFCANPSPHWLMPFPTAHAVSTKVQDRTVQEHRTPPKRAPPPRVPLMDRFANAVVQQKPIAGSKSIHSPQAKPSTQPESQELTKDQPPVRPPIHTTRTTSTVFKKPPLIPYQPQPEEIPDDSLDDFFVSNTQIQRELSPPPAPPSKITFSHAIPTIYPPIPTSRQPPAPRFLKPPISNEDTTDLLTFISTQDLDFTNELTQIAPLPAVPNETPYKTSINEKEEGGAEGKEEAKVKAQEEGGGGGGEEEEDFPDDELESLVLQIPLESPPTIKPSIATKGPLHHPQPQTYPFAEKNDRDSGNIHHDSHALNTKPSLQPSFLNPKTKESQHHSRMPPPQELSAAAEAAEWDAFDILSTQDLISLDVS